MTAAFRGSDGAIVAFIDAVVAIAAGKKPERRRLPECGALIGQLSTQGLTKTQATRKPTTGGGSE